MKVKCQDCHKFIIVYKPIEPDNYLFCNGCLKNKKICSASKAKDIFLLDDDDFKNLKNIYTGNSKNKNRFFIFSDVEEVMLKKYKSIENLEKIKHNKANSKIDAEIDKRRKLLIEVLDDNKLEYKNYGDCYSYVNYGVPSIETVVENELKKLQIKRNRKINLANELSKLDIPLDENLPSCYNFINGIGCKNLVETIREIEIEYYFKNNTNYLKYLEKVDPGKAKILAKSEINTNNIRVNFD